MTSPAASTPLDLSPIHNWMNQARPTPFNMANFVLTARTHIAGLIAEVQRLNRKDPAAPVLMEESVAADALADALRSAPNGEGLIATLSRDTIQELKESGFVLCRIPEAG